MRFFIAAASAFLVSGAVWAGTVTISSPANNATVGQPFTLKASYSATASHMAVYVDGSKYGSDLSGSSVSESLNLSTGTHRITVQALNSSYSVLAQATIYVNVATTTSMPTLYNLEKDTWSYCTGGCGGTGGTGGQPTGVQKPGITTYEIFSLPSSLFGISGDYGNFYWYLQHANPSNQIVKIIQDYYILIPTTYNGSVTGVEFETQQQVPYSSGANVYNCAWQFRFSDLKMHWYRYGWADIGGYTSADAWPSTGVSFPNFTDGKWHHVQTTCHFTSGTVYHDSFSFDGTVHTLGISFQKDYKNNYSGKFTNGFQLDGVKSYCTSTTCYDKPLKVYVDKYNIQY